MTPIEKLAAVNVAHHARRFHSWTWEHQRLFLWLLGIGTAVGIAADLVMVLAFKVSSISMDCWTAQEEHPTLIAAGVLLCIGIAYLTRSSRIAVGWMMLLCGHLFTHWAVLLNMLPTFPENYCTNHPLIYAKPVPQGLLRNVSRGWMTTNSKPKESSK